MTAARILTFGYLGWLLLDGVLSVVDNIGIIDQHVSGLTTCALGISPVVFVVAAVLGATRVLRPRWPLLVASGFYSIVLAALLTIAFLKGMIQRPDAVSSADSRRAWRNINLIGATSQLLVGTVCLVGVLRARRDAPAER